MGSSIAYFPFSPRLHEYSVETALATVIDGDATLKVNTQHLRDLSFRVGSVYQFIGELLIQPDNKVCSCQDAFEFLLHLALAFTLGHMVCFMNTRVCKREDD